MSNMIELKSADLTGPALDWAVATAERLDCSTYYYLHGGYWVVPVLKAGYNPENKIYWYSPSSDWEHGGRLIEKHAISLNWLRSGYQANPAKLNAPTFYVWGSTALIAACRAIVTDKMGETVSIPAELHS